MIRFLLSLIPLEPMLTKAEVERIMANERNNLLMILKNKIRTYELEGERGNRIESIVFFDDIEKEFWKRGNCAALGLEPSELEQKEIESHPLMLRRSEVVKMLQAIMNSTIQTQLMANIFSEYGFSSKEFFEIPLDELEEGKE